MLTHGNLKKLNS